MNISRKFFTDKRSRGFIAISACVAALAALILLSLGTGAVRIPAEDIIKIISKKDVTSNNARILLHVRLPRTLCAILAGSALAVSGTILQSVLRNPIVSPNIIGVNAGSGLFSLIAAVFFPSVYFLSPVFAFAGAVLAGFTVYFIGYKTGASGLTIVLAGVAVTSILSAMSDTVITLFPDEQINRTAFYIGGLNSVTMQNVKFTVIYIAAGLVAAMLFSYDLNILALGDETAVSLGLNVNRTRFIYIITASLLAACAVSIAGLIGFIGLIVPHAAGFLAGSDNRYRIPVAASLGASFLLLCDTAARTLFAPYELPVGIILSFLGAPFFIYLLIKRKGRAND
jgi:iron complex transport system permease protein